MTLVARLRERIAASGPLPFDEFMETCLYDPADGFFTTGPLRSSTGGDFLTSPEVSPWFGRTLGRFVAAEQARLAPHAVTLIEAGAGSGSLLAPLLDERDGAVSGEVWAVEASPAARAALAQILPPPRVVDTMGALPRSLHGVVIANELLDNLPVALASRRQDGWAELRVTVSGDTLALTPVPPRPHVAAWAVRYGGASPVGGQVEVEQAAAEWVTAMVGRLTAGTLVVVDYGGTSGELAHRRAEGTLRTYRGHHLGPDPLLEPGATDVTVDVDFTAMRDAAEAAGATVTVLRQDDFLTEWGLREAVDALRAREAECARAGDTIGQLRARDERIGAETLLHPRGLGDFRVLLARV